MRFVLREPILIDGLTWPAGEVQVRDPYWARALRAAGASVHPEDQSPAERAAEVAAEAAISDVTAPDDPAPTALTTATLRPARSRRRMSPALEE